MEPELQKKLDEINQNLIEIRKKSSVGIWRSFFNGIFSALGYVIGLALIVFIIGWTLNKMGLLKPFQQQVKDFQVFYQRAQNLFINNDENTSSSTKGETVITLPDGQQVRVSK